MESVWKAATANSGEPPRSPRPRIPLHYAKSALAATDGEPSGPLAMQKVEGSSTFIRFKESPAQAGFLWRSS
jgi:hypothetical protein